MACRRGLYMRMLSVRLFVCQTRVLWQNEIKFCPAFYTTWKNIDPSFPTRRMDGRTLPVCIHEIMGPFVSEIMGLTDPVRGNTLIFNIILMYRPRLHAIQRGKKIKKLNRSASVVTLSGKSLSKTNKKSTAHFPMNLRWTSYAAAKPLKVDSKTQNDRFLSKTALRFGGVTRVCVTRCGNSRCHSSTRLVKP